MCLVWLLVQAEYGKRYLCVAVLQTSALPVLVQQDGLHLVVAMVRHTDAAGCYVLAKLVEIAVTQRAGSHFDGYLMQFGVTICVKVYSV